MATIFNFKAGTDLPNSLKDFMLLSELTPGDEPSYAACKAVYVAHPLGAKMTETPVTMAQSQDREIACPSAPSSAVDAFKDEFTAIGATEAIRQTKVMSRVYGIATCGVVAEGVPPDRPLVPKQLRDLRIAFNIWDPLNTAGSLVFNQNPNALDFMKQGQHVAVAGQQYHPSRTIVVINERPVYLSWTPGAFGFVGRSVYQRAWYPLKSYLKTLISDDMIATKAGVIVAKIKAPGSISDNIMMTAFGQKRNVVKEAEVGNVINIGIEEEVASLDLMNIEGPSRMSRENIIKNAATAADMPAILLLDETYVEGFGEGTEDARRVAMFVKRMREEMEPQYRWFDEIAMHRAWSPEYYTTVQKRYPEVFGKVAYTQAFYAWKNSFKATWPNFLEEEDSEKIRTEEVILNAAIAVVQTLLPISDPVNQTKLASFLADTLNDQETLFKTPLDFDVEALEDHLQQQQQKQEEQEEAMKAAGPGGGGEEGEGGEGGEEGGGQKQIGGPPSGGGGEAKSPFGQMKVPKPGKISGGGVGDSMYAMSADDKVSRALNRLHDSVERLPERHRGSKDQVRTMMDGLAKRSGVRK
jgi:hypothetical protein